MPVLAVYHAEPVAGQCRDVERAVSLESDRFVLVRCTRRFDQRQPRATKQVVICYHTHERPSELDEPRVGAGQRKWTTTP
jgi:hypothetical protein